MLISRRPLQLLALPLIALTAMACGKKDSSFSILATGDQYQQVSGTANKVDILWVVDPSGTMANHQDNLAKNFESFISGFIQKKFDYHMAVASVDGWMREDGYRHGGCVADPNPTGNPATRFVTSADCKTTLATYADLSSFRDGDIYGKIDGTPGVRSGNFLLTGLMSATEATTLFSQNVKVGVRGDGTRESAFQSLRAVLRRNADGSIGYGGETHTALSQFRRDDAFLAVIIVSDEEDQGVKPDGTPYSSKEEYAQEFVRFMDGYTNAVDGVRKYNVSSITIDDINNCGYGLHAQATQGDRYVAIANAANGVVGSICSADFSSKLSDIANQIVTLSTRFELTREPKIETISVVVNGKEVAKDAANGWQYVVENGHRFIEFRGASTPESGASISIQYDPTEFL